MTKPLEHVKHSFKPVYNEQSKILLLGSFPSVKSRENNFYYGHKQNRFWPLMSRLFNCSVPISIEEKIDVLISNKIALYDTILECDIHGSADSSIINAEPTDILNIIKNSSIDKVYANGKLAYRLYEKYHLKNTNINAGCLPSTSAANARYSLDKLVNIWGEVLKV